MDQRDALLGLEQLDQVGEVGPFDVRHQRTHLLRIVFLQRLGDRAHEFGGRRRPPLMRSNLLSLGHVGALRKRGQRQAPAGMTVFALRA